MSKYIIKASLVMIPGYVEHGLEITTQNGNVAWNGIYFGLGCIRNSIYISFGICLVSYLLHFKYLLFVSFMLFLFYCYKLFSFLREWEKLLL
jgi:protein-S-isoprenylcysteine O-methyltransferase Ste14